MSGADDLRADDLIDDLIRAVMDHTHGREGVLDRKGAEKDLREYVADPERRLAILDAMGLGVTEMWSTEDTAPTSYRTTPGSSQLTWVPVLVVRPRGEATDA